jgi:hypothetical protein
MDSINTKKINVVVQENGIIRNNNGFIIARLIEEVDYKILEEKNPYIKKVFIEK